MNGRRLCAFAITILLVACSTNSVQYGTRVSDTERGLYTIREGESLYAIAWRYGLDYKQIASWNHIQPPYTIYPGQRIKLNPPPTARVEQTRPITPSPSPTPSSPPPVARTTPVVVQPTLPPSPPVHSPPPVTPTAPQVTAHGWQWPLQGDVIRAFEPYGNGKKGIGIAGQPGQPIQAASGGRVVYSGGGLVGYGQLIIIKHDQNFLSAYAHNRKLLVKEGDQVRLGQTIAELGDTGASRPMLHFEIRHEGTPVDPLRYLPKR